METVKAEEIEEFKKPIFRDIRRYYCEFCGICRSKKSLIRSHVLSHHKDEMTDLEYGKYDSEQDVGKKGEYTCVECGATFKKPAYLKQHMQGHLLERPFSCPVEECSSSYRRKDHLNRHLLTHQGKLFDCPIENCNKKFSIQGNMTRHVKEIHDNDSCASTSEDEKQYICSEVGCGKQFKYASKLRKHEDSHVTLEYIEVICGEPGCLKKFTNAECLKAHRLSCHQTTTCEICGTQQLKKNIRRHLRIHQNRDEVERIMCDFPGCQHTFSNKSNLDKHVKAIHQKIKPFSCRFSGCGQTFPYKHVRDNHEKSSAHVHTFVDFVEADEQWRSRPRGGRKRSNVPVEMLMRKRIAPLSQDNDSLLDNGAEYLDWLLSN